MLSEQEVAAMEARFKAETTDCASGSHCPARADRVALIADLKRMREALIKLKEELPRLFMPSSNCCFCHECRLDARKLSTFIVQTRLLD